MCFSCTTLLLARFSGRLATSASMNGCKEEYPGYLMMMIVTMMCVQAYYIGDRLTREGRRRIVAFERRSGVYTCLYVVLVATSSSQCSRTHCLQALGAR